MTDSSTSTGVPSPEQSSMDAALNAAGAYLLIVDDVAVNLQALESILKTKGFRVEKATSGEQALEAVAKEPPDLILLDVMMPKMNGYEVCQRLQENPEHAKIPVIFLTGRNDSYSIIKGFSAGAVDYIVKPFHAPELLARIKTHLELKRSRDVILKMNALLDAEKRHAEDLLLNILPSSIASRLQAGERSLADKFENATVLFADIINFTPLAEQYSPEELVRLLNHVFSAFDALAEQYGVEKIKTMGDSYMAACGIPIQRPDHVQAMAMMALGMIDAVNTFNVEANQSLSIRVGMHCGPVVAGVIGAKKFIYDLWGDTVNTASRMESHGEGGKIHVTESVRQALADSFLFEERGTISIKGKGIMKTYFLLGKKS